MHESKEERYIRLIENALSRGIAIDYDALKLVPVEVNLTEDAAMEIVGLLNELKELREQKPCEDAVSRKWLLEYVNEGWIKFDTEKDENRFIHLVRDIAPSASRQAAVDEEGK